MVKATDHGLGNDAAKPLNSTPDRHILAERQLRRVLAEYVTYFNQWRPHRSIGQRAPCAPAPWSPGHHSGEVVAVLILGGLHHVYQRAA